MRRLITWLREHVLDTIWDHGIAILLTALLTSAATAAVTSKVVVEEVRTIYGVAECMEWPGCPHCICCPPCEVCDE
jgi:hypothetical protein